MCRFSFCLCILAENSVSVFFTENFSLVLFHIVKGVGQTKNKQKNQNNLLSKLIWMEIKWNVLLHSFLNEIAVFRFWQFMLKLKFYKGFFFFCKNVIDKFALRTSSICAAREVQVVIKICKDFTPLC